MQSDASGGRRDEKKRGGGAEAEDVPGMDTERRGTDAEDDRSK